MSTVITARRSCPRSRRSAPVVARHIVLAGAVVVAHALAEDGLHDGRQLGGGLTAGTEQGVDGRGVHQAEELALGVGPAVLFGAGCVDGARLNATAAVAWVPFQTMRIVCTKSAPVYKTRQRGRRTIFLYRRKWIQGNRQSEPSVLPLLLSARER